MSTNNFLIAGQNCGIHVNIVPALKPTYLALERSAQNGSHWARLTVSGLKALSSGRLGRNNIFVRPGSSMNFGIEEFFVILPGCKATVENQPNGTYKIVGLTLDSGYFELNSQNSMTGLYNVDKQGTQWEAKYLKNGRIIPDGGTAIRQRVVGIADIGYSNADRAVSDISKLISKAPGAGGKYFKSFDLHYTASEGRTLGGLRNYSHASKPLTNSSIYGSAILLANTMHKAKNIEGISWVSEFGGSAVLTQAMKILADQGVTLKNHTAFLYRPNTNVDEAASWAHKIGLDLDRKFVLTTAGDFMGNRNQVGMIFKRFKAEKDYRIGNACWDLAAQGKNVQGGIAMSAMAIGSAGVAMTVPAWPILASIGTALGLTIGALKVGDALTEQFAPRFYNKHIGKIK